MVAQKIVVVSQRADVIVAQDVVVVPQIATKLM